MTDEDRRIEIIKSMAEAMRPMTSEEMQEWTKRAYAEGILHSLHAEHQTISWFDLLGGQTR